MVVHDMQISTQLKSAAILALISGHSTRNHIIIYIPIKIKRLKPVTDEHAFYMTSFHMASFLC
jgi:hypothetical protein